MCKPLDPDIKSILFNILGGIIVSLITWGCIKIKSEMTLRKFKKLFGTDSPSDVKLVYGKMYLSSCFDKYGRKVEFPFYKPEIKDNKFKLSSILSDTDAVSIKYISDCFCKVTKKSPLLTNDESIIDNLNISYISFGGLNNLKSKQVLDSEENDFFKFESSSSNGTIDCIKSKNNPDESYKISSTIDYALILKISPRQNPSRTQFCIAGIGEPGTRGAAYYLGQNWNDIRKKTKGMDFGMIIKTQIKYDESAEMEKFQIRTLPKK